MTARRKHIYARVSLQTGERLSDWHNIRFTNCRKALNAGLAECVFELGEEFDYDGNDLLVGNDVELIVADADTTSGGHDGSGTRLIYKGYISLIERVVDHSSEKIIVHLLGYYTLLSLDVLKSGTQTTLYSTAAGLTTTSGSQAAGDVGILMREIIDQYRAETVNPKLYYNGENDIPDTGTSVTYTFQRKTYRQAIDTLKSFAPDGVYWYVDETGRVTFKPKPASATHTFVFGAHFSTVRIEQSLEKVRNFVLVWDGASLHAHYQDNASITKYGRRVEIANDYGIANANASDEFGAKFLAEAKQPSVKVVCTILDNSGGALGYDIESIQPGDTCKFVGFGSGVSDAFHDNMLITSVDYSLEQATIEVEIIRSGLLDRQTRQSQDISDIASGGLGVPASYS